MNADEAALDHAEADACGSIDAGTAPALTKPPSRCTHPDILLMRASNSPCSDPMLLQAATLPCRRSRSTLRTSPR